MTSGPPAVHEREAVELSARVILQRRKKQPALCHLLITRSNVVFYVDNGAEVLMRFGRTTLRALEQRPDCGLIMKVWIMAKLRPVTMQFVAETKVSDLQTVFAKLKKEDIEKLTPKLPTSIPSAIGTGVKAAPSVLRGVPTVSKSHPHATTSADVEMAAAPRMGGRKSQTIEQIIKASISEEILSDSELRRRATVLSTDTQLAKLFKLLVSNHIIPQSQFWAEYDSCQEAGLGTEGIGTQSVRSTVHRAVRGDWRQKAAIANSALWTAAKMRSEFSLYNLISEEIKRVRRMEELIAAAKDESSEEKQLAAAKKKLADSRISKQKIKLTITDEMCVEIFAHMSNVKQVFDRLVPEHIDSKQFWASFVSSQFFKQTMDSSSITASASGLSASASAAASSGVLDLTGARVSVARRRMKLNRFDKELLRVANEKQATDSKSHGSGFGFGRKKERRLPKSIDSAVDLTKSDAMDATVLADELDLYASVIAKVDAVDSTVSLMEDTLPQAEVTKRGQMAMQESADTQKWFALVNRHGRTLVEESMAKRQSAANQKCEGSGKLIGGIKTVDLSGADEDGDVDMMEGTTADVGSGTGALKQRIEESTELLDLRADTGKRHLELKINESTAFGVGDDRHSLVTDPKMRQQLYDCGSQMHREAAEHLTASGTLTTDGSFASEFGFGGISDMSSLICGSDAVAVLKHTCQTAGLYDEVKTHSRRQPRLDSSLSATESKSVDEFGSANELQHFEDDELFMFAPRTEAGAKMRPIAPAMVANIRTFNYHLFILFKHYYSAVGSGGNPFMTGKQIPALMFARAQKVEAIVRKNWRTNLSKFFKDHLKEPLKPTNALLVKNMLTACDSLIAHWQRLEKEASAPSPR